MQEQFTSSDYLIAIRDFALNRGLNLQDLVANTTLTLEDLFQPPAVLDRQNVLQFCFNFYSGLDNIYRDAMDYGASLSLAYHGPLGVAAQGSRTLLDGIELVSQFYALRIPAPRISFTREPSFVSCQVVQSGECPVAEMSVFFELAVLTCLAENARRLLALSPQEFNYTLSMNFPEPDSFPHDHLESCTEINFDCPAMELRVPMKFMQLELPSENSQLVQTAVELCRVKLLEIESGNLVEVIRSSLLTSKPNAVTIKSLSSQLNVSVSTLKRRMSDCGVTFREIKDQVIEESANHLMITTTANIESISESLGFSDTSNFVKSYRRLTGETPRKFREKNRTISRNMQN